MRQAQKYRFVIVGRVDKETFHFLITYITLLDSGRGASRYANVVTLLKQKTNILTRKLAARRLYSRITMSSKRFRFAEAMHDGDAHLELKPKRARLGKLLGKTVWVLGATSPRVEEQAGLKFTRRRKTTTRAKGLLQVVDLIIHLPILFSCLSGNYLLLPLQWLLPREAQGEEHPRGSWFTLV